MTTRYPRKGGSLIFYIVVVIFAVLLAYFGWIWLRQRPAAPVHTEKPQSSQVMPGNEYPKFSAWIRASASLPA